MKANVNRRVRVLALVGLLWMYTSTGLRSFDLVALERHVATSPLDPQLQRWIFPLLAIGFGIIAPLWPLHSWSPIGHAAAPSAVSMLHAGVLMKLGSYAIIRLALGLLPQGAQMWLPWMAGLCTMNIIYGGFVAMAQKDLKFIIGYSSSSHMGYVLLGIASLSPLGLNGAVLLMFAHGLMTALAFALVGHIYDQTHTYLPAFLFSLASIATACVLIWLARPSAVRASTAAAAMNARIRLYSASACPPSRRRLSISVAMCLAISPHSLCRAIPQVRTPTGGLPRRA
jgi:NADH-quinone oxidoreductase subunit M